ncbi:MAG: hypothetical protein D6785_14530 [Planctomycetota bacterium]|nr:MAG: hypothetical protein D6785_14530 [Planctomycetota bacterium]
MNLKKFPKRQAFSLIDCIAAFTIFSLFLSLFFSLLGEKSRLLEKTGNRLHAQNLLVEILEKQKGRTFSQIKKKGWEEKVSFPKFPEYQGKLRFQILSPRLLQIYGEIVWKEDKERLEKEWSVLLVYLPKKE